MRGMGLWLKLLLDVCNVYVLMFFIFKRKFNFYLIGVGLNGFSDWCIYYDIIFDFVVVNVKKKIVEWDDLFLVCE